MPKTKTFSKKKGNSHLKYVKGGNTFVHNWH